jgi:hypothetical protein
VSAVRREVVEVVEWVFRVSVYEVKEDREREGYEEESSSEHRRGEGEGDGEGNGDGGGPDLHDYNTDPEIPLDNLW